MPGTPFLTELRIFSSNIVPKGWIACNGQILPINQYQALFSLLGTTYGGNGVTTFAVPNLNGRVPLHRGTNYKNNFHLSVGEMGGKQTHTLTLNEIPNHTHQAVASSFLPDRNTPENNFWAANTAFKPYGSENNNPPMAATALSKVGENMPHDNMAPFLVLNICMAVYGLYPLQDKNVISDAWLSEIRIFAGGIFPYYWSFCDGQEIPLSSNTQLFGLLGTNYGGNGQTTLGLPNLQASAPLMTGQGNGLSQYQPGEVGGVPSVTLTVDETPLHTHAAMAKESGNEGEPEGRIWGNPGSQLPLPNFFSSSLQTNPQEMNTAAIGSTGGGRPHNNMMPFAVLTYCITTNGDVPPR